MTASRIDRTLDGLLPGNGTGRRELVLRGHFVEPRHLVAAAAVAYRLRTEGHEVKVSCGQDQATYVSRMHLRQALDEFGAAHDLRPVRERDHAEDLLEVVRLWGAADARRLAALVHGKVVDQDAATADALWECLTEFGANVQDHAAAGLGVSAPGYSAAQTMPRSSEIVFAVADPGVGILRTLAAAGARTDQEAIGLALSGLSRFPDKDRGHGLQDTLDLVTHLGGCLYVASGRASALATYGKVAYMSLRSPFPGTLLQGRIPFSARPHH